MAINFPASPTTNQTYTYNGRTWTWNGVGWQATGASGLSVYTKTDFTATAAQTTFTVAYTVGFVDVYYNGSKLSITEYTATNGTSVVLGTACAVNDIVETVAWTVSTTLNPALGVATATSLAIGGATIGTNALAVTGTTLLNSALTYGGVTLSNAVTGTGNMVLSASPTFTGTIIAAGATFSSPVTINDSTEVQLTMGGSNGSQGRLRTAWDGTGAGGRVTLSAKNIAGTLTDVFKINGEGVLSTLLGPLNYGGVTLSNSVTGTGSMVLSASPTLTGTLTGSIGTFSGNINGGAGGTSTGIGALTLNGGSAAGGGSLIYLYRNSVIQGYIGHTSAINGTANNNLSVYSTAGIDLYTNSGTTLAALSSAGVLTVSVAANNGANTEVLSIKNPGSGGGTSASLGFYAAGSKYAEIIGGYPNGPGFMFNVSGGLVANLTATGFGVSGGNLPNFNFLAYTSGSTKSGFQAGNSNTGAGSTNGAFFGVDTTGNADIDFGSALPLLFKATGTEVMRLTQGGLLGIGMTPVLVLDITQNQNTFSAIKITNSDAGASASSRLIVSNGTSAGQIMQFGTGNSSGTVRANGTMLYAGGAGGLTLETGTAQPIYFTINSAEKARFGTDGSFLVGTTTNAGAGAISCVTNGIGTFSASNIGAGGYTINGNAVSNGGNYYYANFTGGTGGSIINNGSITTYSATSDERLKDWEGIVQSDKRQMISDVWLGDFDVYDDFTKAGTPHRGFGVRAQQAYGVLGEQFGFARPEKETDKWQAPSEPMAYLSLWGVKDLYKIIDDLTTRLAALEAK